MDDTPLRMRLPVELLRQIVLDYAFSERQTEDFARKSYKPKWTTIQPLTIASKILRILALEAWFEVYFAHSPEDLLHAWPEFHSWTRELHCIELGTDLQVLPVQWNLQSFRRLRKLRVDFDPIQSNGMLLLRFDYPRNIAAHIQELELFDISWPSPGTLQIMAQAFPGLRSLKLSQDLIWCGLCNICRFATFKDPPPPEIVYDKIVGLPAHYLASLKQLANLQTITLSIGYGLGGMTSLTKNNDNLWTGECDACMDIMFTMDDFRNEWIEQKKSLQRPPALKTVKWQFRHKNPGDVVVDLEGDPLTSDTALLEDSGDDGSNNTEADD